MEIAYWILEIFFYIGIGFASVMFTLLLMGVFDKDTPWKNND